jgi:hypothetical protein
MISSHEIVEISARKTAKVLLEELQVLAEKMFATIAGAPAPSKTMTLQIPEDQYQAFLNHRPKFRPSWSR